ncbi:phasin family protein [Ferrimonas senticii]|uniref:phasin family protein n=1 Tax=Ferrimonas senticii TaxID=394566 RepID=UPI0003F58ABE|nr:phasin family protein [Ferrimonas senticii]
MFNDMKQQMEDSLQHNIDQQVKIQQAHTQLLTDIANRNSEYLNDLLKSSSEVSQGLSECRTPMQLLDKQSEIASEFSAKAEAYVKSNVESFSSYSTLVAEMTKSFWQVPQAQAPKRKPATK